MKKVDKVLEYANKVSNNNYLKAISNGLMATLPVNIIGSVALLLAVLPVDSWQNFIGSIGLTPYLFIAFNLTVGIISIYAAFLIGYRFATNLNQSAIPAGVLSLFVFLMMTPMANFDGVSTLDMSKLGAQGLFTAMISSLLFTRLYCFLIEKNITIKMPDGVPPFVKDQFNSLVPVIITGFSAVIVSLLFGFTTYGSFSEFVYTLIAAPLEGLSSNVGSLLVIVLVQMALWFFGIHGSMVVGGFVTALYLPMDVANMEAVAAGAANSELPNVMGATFYNIFSGIGGAGGTLSLIIVLLIFAKSKQSRTIASLSAAPGMFTINEPIIFGFPLILNPIMAIPFITVPLVQTLIAFIGISSGIFPRLSGVQVPFGTPILLNGFIAGGWRIALLQIICIAVGCLIYYPFVKVADKKMRENENSASN